MSNLAELRELLNYATDWRKGDPTDSDKWSRLVELTTPAELLKLLDLIPSATSCPGHGRSECVSCCWPKGERETASYTAVDMGTAAADGYRDGAEQLRESDRLRDRMEVAINTLVYCYDKRPENFAAALTEAQRLAAESRDAKL